MTANLTPRYTTIIFDIGDVLFSWSPDTKTTISSKTLQCIMSSHTWFDYERGIVTQEDCYARVGNEFSLDPEEIRTASIQASQSLQSNDVLISAIGELKSSYDGKLRVLAMSNISLPDYDVVRSKSANWSIFDNIFTSGEVGKRKPDLDFYKHVITAANIDPEATIFVDDKVENILSARSFGFHGIVFDTSNDVIRSLRNLLGNPIQRGEDFLARNAGNLHSVTDTGALVQEHFAQLLILEITGARNLVCLSEPSRRWNFFSGPPNFTTEEYPDDLDTTSLGLTIVKTDQAVISSVMIEMLEYVNSDGIVQMCFAHKRPRVDAVACVNILTLFYSNGRGSDLDQTREWVYRVLYNRAYVDGTQYYLTAECFLYLLTRLLTHSDDPPLHQLFDDLLRERVRERIGAPGDALALAMRISICVYVGIKNEIDLRTLLGLQCDDGGWEGFMYRFRILKVNIGNRGLATALSVKAITDMSDLLRQTVGN